MSSASPYPVPSHDNSFHLNPDGQPTYTQRFKLVGKFHDPGLAPAHDGAGWSHIHPDGQAAYLRRYELVWGFYYGRAAAKDSNGWTHIDATGEAVYPERYRWAGNYQEGFCAVQSAEGFFHIDEVGRRAYQEIHAYVGDYRDGVAVATSALDGLSRHIKPGGSLLHPHAFIDLDIFHKGFARAKDSRGWHHIDASGTECYAERYVSIEPFYNGLARADAPNGSRVRIDAKGAAVDVFPGGWLKSTEHGLGTGGQAVPLVS